MSDFVLEIGVENVPASYLPPAIEQLAADARALLARGRLVYDEVYATATPRRLVLMVRGLAERQSEAEELVTGPPVARAFTPEGKATPAAEGFARAQGVEVAALERVATPRGEYLAVRKRLARSRSTEVLSGELPTLVGGLKFPKTMKWESSGARFARPVRWMVALYGKQVVSFAFAGVASGRVTWGRPWMQGMPGRQRTRAGGGSEQRSIADAGSYRARVA